EVVEQGAVTEVTEAAVDLRALPVPVHALDDAAPHFAAVALHKDPETGERRLGLVRLQVAGPADLLLEEGGDGPLRDAAARASALGRSVWVTLNLGAAPAACIAAALPQGAAAFGSSPFAVAN